MTAKPLILMLHGACLGAWSWELLGRKLKEAGYETQAIDYPGHGSEPTPKPLRKLRVSDYTDFVADAIQKLNRPVILIGHSMGGLIAQKLVEKYPQLPIEHLILLAPVPTDGVWYVTLKTLFQNPFLFLKINLFQTIYPLISTPKLVRKTMYTPQTLESLVKFTHENSQDESYFAFLDMLVFNLAKEHKVKGKVKITLIGGEKDYLFPPNFMHKTAKKYGITAHILPNQTHNFFMEESCMPTLMELILKAISS